MMVHLGGFLEPLKAVMGPTSGITRIVEKLLKNILNNVPKLFLDAGP